MRYLLPAIVLLPLAAGLAAFAIPSHRVRRGLLVGVALANVALIGTVAPRGSGFALWDWLAVDSLGLLFLAVTGALFLAAALYGVGRLREESLAAAGREGWHKESVFTGCLLLFLSAMSLVCLSNRIGLQWVGVESTTLASAPLIYYNRKPRSLEAAWKYLLICSIGIALALLGIFLLAVAATGPDGVQTPLMIDQMARGGAGFNRLWLKAAFIFLLIGYGTKMGLAPMHTWLPDAHSEAPSTVSALLSGALLNCAFLGILRAQQICCAAGLGDFSRELLTVFGLISMAFAAVFMVKQGDYKRMLAYSSVEHMGILALGIGLGGAASFGALFHAVNHSLTKGLLFLAAGNILAFYGTKSAQDVRGVRRALPVTGALWLAGFFAITGTPPFGTFLSEFIILKAAVDQGRMGVAAAYLGLLAVIFLAMSSIVLRMTQGPAAGPELTAGAAPKRERWLAVLPPAALGAVVLLLGVYVPPALSSLLNDAARLVGGR